MNALAEPLVVDRPEDMEPPSLTPEALVERQSAVARALGRVLPAANILWKSADTRPYECDGLSMFRQQPMVVALPENAAQVAEILKLCAAMQVPVVARGAGTSLSGGAMPHGEGVLLALGKLSRIIDLDPLARTATVEPGVRNLAISEAAAPHGLHYAPDPSSQIACSIGGNIAENSGGVHCLKYGLTVHNVLAIRGFTMRGEAIEFGSLAPDTPGLDLMALMIGSEGMLAVATEIVVRLIPKPQAARLIMASFDDVATAGDAVAAIISAGIIPAGLEMMDRQATRMVEPFAEAGYDLDAAAILLCESDGTPEEVDHEIVRMEAVLSASGATRLVVAKDEDERYRYWAGRKNAFPAAGRVSPDYYCMDGTIPKKRLGEMLKAIQDMEVKYRLRCPNVFHAGDGNLHPLVLFDANDADELKRAEDFGAEILELCVALGGTITGEHGVGIEKIAQMCVQFAPPELAAFRGVKRAFDPDGLLNPDKGVPTLRRCAEGGRMHVHGGALPHPDLPRF